MLLRFPRSADSHEAWFEQRYDELLQWAVRITGGDRDQAEDLVHDAFVHFIARRPDLSAIDNASAYLYTSLRNLHLSNARRAARRQETVVRLGGFDLLDYESLRSSLQVVQEFHAAELRVEFQHQLRAIWRYAQLRKRSSKMAIVLTLRFFHGYYPEEITRILRISRDATDQLLRRARKEARAFIAAPQTSSTGHDAEPLQAWPAHGLLEPPDLALALHDAALNSDPEGVCLTSADLDTLYGSDGSQDDPDAASLSTDAAAHIVSCRACLDRVTARLGLPPLASRHPLDSLGYDTDQRPPQGGPGAGAGGGAAHGPKRSARQRVEAGRRRVSDLLARAPKELRVSINGVILGSHQVTSSVNRLTLRVTSPDVAFIEVFDEHETRLLFADIEPPPRGPVEVRETLALDAGRRLDAHIDFAGAAPVLHVSYVDPSLAAPPLIAPAPAPPPKPHARGGASSRLRRWASRVAGAGAWMHPSRWRLTRGGAFTTLLMATIIAALVLNQVSQPVLSAAELLRKSAAADTAWAADRTLAIHRTIDLEARSAAGPATRRRVEVWHSAARGLTVRRVYDDRGALLAGEWIGANGAHAIHRRFEGLAGAAEPAVQGRDAWRIDLSAAEFMRLMDNGEPAIVTRDADRYRVAVVHQTTTDRVVVAASLTLRADYRAVEQRATVRGGQGVTEFTWTERQRLAHPADAAPAGIFDVDGRFTADAAPVAASPVAIAPATPGLELRAFAALRRIDADLGEEVRIERVNGRLEIAGVVASAPRQAQIRSSLAEVARHPAVRLRIETVGDVHARARRRPAAPPIEPAEPMETPGAASPLVWTPPRIAAHEQVRQYLVSIGVPASDADGDVARLANRVVQQANRMRVHAWALRTLGERITAAEVDQMASADRRQWQSLIAEHGRAFRAEAESLRAIVAPVFPDRASRSSAAGPLATDAQIRAAAARLVHTAVSLNEMMVQAFTLPTADRMSAAPLEPSRFWPAFADAVTLAESLARSASQP